MTTGGDDMVLEMIAIKSTLVFLPMVGVNALETYHLYALQQAAGPQRTMASDGTLLGQFVILVTTIATLLYQIFVRHAEWKEKERQRKWDLEDRAAAREKIAEAQVAVHEKLDHTTRTVVREHLQLRQAIDENTNITTQAAAKASVAAAKAAATDQRISELRRIFEGDAAEQLDRIDTNTEETVERLRSSEEGTQNDSSSGGRKPNGKSNDKK